MQIIQQPIDIRHHDIFYAQSSRKVINELIQGDQSVTSPNSVIKSPCVSSSVSPQNAPLGIMAESSSPREESQKIASKIESVKATWKARYQMLNRAAVLLPSERIAQCSWRPAPLASHVVGRYNASDGSSYLANLIQCESYACPICAQRRAEDDRRALSVAFAQAGKLELHGLMITLTLSHHTGDRLDELRAGLAKAFDATFSGRWYDELGKEYGIKGKIKSWEVTYGKNGWHPHLHVLAFLELELAGRWLDELKAKIAERWQAKLAQLGFDASFAHGVDVTTADSEIAEYIAKWGREPIDKAWGADAEIAKSPVKKAHNDGLTPFQLLAASSGDSEAIEQIWRISHIEEREQIVALADDLYCEYFHAFKGKPRLFWGKVKALLQLDQALLSVEDSNPPHADYVDMALIERGEAWGRVLALPDGRAELRAVLSTGDAFKVLAWFGQHGIPVTVPDEAKRWTMEREKGFSAVEPVEPHKLKTANGDKPAAAHRQSEDVCAPVYIGPEGVHACREAESGSAPDIGSVAQSMLPGLSGWVRYD